jgi:LacI family transcriptional regulator
MRKSVSIQDIADALGMSRNTVSKALNGKHVPVKTRNAVISAAIEMGYKGYKLAATSEGAIGHKRYVILSTRLLMNITFFISVLKGIEESLMDYDIDLVQFSITNSASFAKFKRYLTDAKVDGIICMEFFEPDYITQLLEQSIPLVFFDFPLLESAPRGSYDIILPESEMAVKYYCMQLIREAGCKTFGFVGDYRHCRSFYERFAGMREALFLSGLPVDLRYSILEDDSSGYTPEKLSQKLDQLPSLPDCFVTANDSIAINLIAALKNKKIHIPKDVKVVGFDNNPKAKNLNPQLTSFNVDKVALGKKITALLQERVSNPTQANQVIHIASKVIVRAST